MSLGWGRGAVGGPGLSGFGFREVEGCQGSGEEEGGGLSGFGGR